MWTCGFEHTEFWNRVQTCLRVRVGPRVPGSHLRPLVGHRACPEHPRRGREHVQCLDLRVGLRLSPGSQGPGGEGGVPGGGRERSRIIFYILSAAMQGGAQSDEGLSETQSLQGRARSRMDDLSSRRTSVVGRPQPNVERSASILTGVSEWCLVPPRSGCLPSFRLSFLRVLADEREGGVTVDRGPWQTPP